MKQKYILLILIASLITYIIVINLINSASFQNARNNNTSNSISGGADVRINMGDSVTVSIVRNRWYGKIYEEGDSKILYLFKKIKLPLEDNGKDYLPFHIFFSLLWLIILMGTLNSRERNSKTFK